MLEKRILERFFELATSFDTKTLHSKSVATYQSLIYHRYDELLTDTYPIFRSFFDDARWRELVLGFASSKPRDPLIWRAADEFRSFISKQKPKETPFANELLWLEWSEIEVSMCEPKKSPNPFNWKINYALNHNVKLKKLTYPVHLKDFTNKKKSILLLYMDINNHGVYYKELTDFLYALLQHLGKKPTLHDVLAHVAGEKNIDSDDAKTILEPLFCELVESGVLVDEEYL